MPVSRDMEILQVLPGTGFAYPVKAGARIYGRALVGLAADGFAVPLGSEAVVFVGIATSGADNRDGQNGAETVEVERDCRAVPLDLTPTYLNQPVFADDDDLTAVKFGVGGFRIGILVGYSSARQGARAVINLMI